MSFRVENQAEPIPGYKLIERIGGGGFGEVWKAEAPGGLLKAIKFVFGDLKTEGGDGPDGHRATQEFKALQRVKSVRHPYILSLERFDVVDGQLMIVMELADKNLWDRFRECKQQGLPGIPREELLRYMEESAEALDLMNMEYQLQHLDIKPQNIFLVYNHIKVADFGLVKDFQGVVASMTGGVTPVYAAPETFDGLVTRFCDQYSLAIVYQELLTGQRPFTGSNVHQLVMQHVQGIPNLSVLPAEEQPIIGRSLAKNPDDRFPSCAEMVRALRAAGAPLTPRSLLATKETAIYPAISPLPTMDTPSTAGEVNPSLTVTTDLPTMRSGLDRPAAPPSLPREVIDSTILPSTTEQEAPLPKAPAEVTGEGELMPALIIGLGNTGLKVLAQFRAALAETFGNPDSLPHIRLLGIDTDAEKVQVPAEGVKPLLPQEVLLHTRLQRAIHYLRPREGRPRLDVWFDTTLLGRLPRDLTAGGMRPLGRLAFIDNYRQIAQRLRDELKACLEPDNLAAASSQTGLSLRTNRPRVYIVTGLGGGTGSGMFIDLAYAVRAQLRQLGYPQPDIVGLMLLPPIDKTGSEKNNASLVNTFGALTELNHYSSAGVTFAARFDEKEAAIQDPGAPFQGCYVLPLPPRTEPEAAERVFGTAGDFLYRELVTPMGRQTDAHRVTATTAPGPRADRLECRSFGLSRFWWPRWALLQGAARQVCRRVTQQWISKEPRTPTERIEQWVEEQWVQKEMGLENLVARVQAACEKVVGQAPESAFSAIHTNLTANRRRGPEAAALRDAVNRIEQLVGQVTASSVLSRSGSLEAVMRQESEALLNDWNKKLLQATSRLVEQPEFHLAGAEEAIRRLLTRIDDALKAQEVLFAEKTENARRDYERLQLMMQNLDSIFAQGRKGTPLITELVEIIRTYPKFRYHSLLLKTAHSTYTTVKGRLGDQLRELGFSRGRLGELLRVFEDARDAFPNLASDPYALLPVGSRSLPDAVEQLVAGLSPQELADLDSRMQNLVQLQFRGFNHLCSSGTSTMRSLGQAMLEESLSYAAPRLQGQDVVSMFLSQHGEGPEAQRKLAGAYDQAAPPGAPSTGASSTEFCVLAAPPSPREATFRELAHHAVPDVNLLPAASSDDLVFYREETNVRLADFEHLGEQGQEAYAQAIARDTLPPHTRTDVTEWRTISK